MVPSSDSNLRSQSEHITTKLVSSNDEERKEPEIDPRHRQSVNVFQLGRGSLYHLKMDPIELSRVRERTRSIQFALKYDQRRSSSAFSKRSSFFT